MRPRLTAQDERDLFARARAGDCEAADRLASAVVPLVWLLARRLHAAYPHADTDELASRGLLALTRALKKYDPDRGYRWATYAGTAARRGMIGVAKEARARADRFPRDEHAPEPDDHPTPEAAPAPVFDLSGMLDELAPIPRHLVALRYGIGHDAHTLVAAARRLGLSRRKAVAHLRSAMSRLRQIAADRGYNS